MQYMIANAKWFRAVDRYINQNSARDLLFEVSSQTTVNPQCYEDTMDFIDALVGARFKQTLNIEHFGWALKSEYLYCYTPACLSEGLELPISE